MDKTSLLRQDILMSIYQNDRKLAIDGSYYYYISFILLYGDSNKELEYRSSHSLCAFLSILL